MLALQVLVERTQSAQFNANPEGLTFLAKVPNEIWAVLTGSMLTIVGVLISNWNSRRMQETRLEHDSTQREMEREHMLRERVYLQAAEAVSISMGAISRLADLKFDPAEAQNSKTVQGVDNKIYLVSKEETAKAVAEFVSEIESSHLSLLKSRFPLQARLQELEGLSDLVKSNQKQIEGVLELMHAENLINADERDWEKWKVLEERYEFGQARYAELSAEQREILQIQSREHAYFAQECSKEFLRLKRMMMRLLVVIRKEVGMVVNEQKFLEATLANLPRIEKETEELLASILMQHEETID